MKYSLVLLLLTTLCLNAETFYSRGMKQYKAKQYPSALKSFYVAARHHDTNSYYMLGKMHEEGIGTGVNLYTAFYWYKRSAQRGNPIAQYRLGYLYENGKGVTKNLTKSKRWYQQASHNGNSDAKMRLSLKSREKSTEIENKPSTEKKKMTKESDSENDSLTIFSTYLEDDDY